MNAATGKIIHIDHLLPLAAFGYSNAADQQIMPAAILG
jgi:hypothetical protein